MNLFYWDLSAGQSKRWPGYGRFFRLLVAQGDISVTASYARGGSVTSKIMAGIGVDLRHPETGEGFISLEFLSDTSQQIKVLVTDLPSTDNRLTGDISVQGALNVVSTVSNIRSVNRLTLNVGSAQVLLAASASRTKALIHFTHGAWLGADNTVNSSNGLYVGPGSDWYDENTSELWVYNTAAGNVVTRWREAIV